MKRIDIAMILLAVLLIFATVTLFTLDEYNKYQVVAYRAQVEKIIEVEDYDYSDENGLEITLGNTKYVFENFDYNRYKQTSLDKKLYLVLEPKEILSFNDWISNKVSFTNIEVYDFYVRYVIKEPEYI